MAVKPTILCPVLQKIPSRKAHDKLLARTCAALARTGAHVVLLAPLQLLEPTALAEHYVTPPAADLEVRPVAPRSVGLLYRASLFRHTKAIEAQVIYTSELEVAALFLLKKQRLEAPVFYEAHAIRADKGGPLAEAEAAVMSRAERILVSVATLAEKIRATYPACAPIEIAPLAAGWEAELAADPTPPSPPLKRLGYIGQLYPLQGVEVLLEALARLPDHELTLVGGKRDEIARLERRAAELAVGSRARFSGYVEPSKLANLIDAIDILLLPSRARGRMPFVGHTKALEYLAFGRPIIAADLPSLKEQLGEDGAALFVAPEDPEAWAVAIQTLSKDADLARTLVATARARARRFTWESRAQRMLEAFGLGSSELPPTRPAR